MLQYPLFSLNNDMDTGDDIMYIHLYVVGMT